MEVLLKVDLMDGNEPPEAVIDLPIIPRKGDLIEICYVSGTNYPVVDDVVLSTSGPSEAWLKFGMYDLEEVKNTMEGARQEMTS